MSNLRTGVKISGAVLALALPLIVAFEGTIFRTYEDPVGILTACTGHTGTELELGQTFTRKECDALLTKDLERFDRTVLSCITRPMHPPAQAAFLSLAFNIGTKNFCGSTLVKKYNQGDGLGACKEILRWTRAKGRELPGLVRRREAEFRLCVR